MTTTSALSYDPYDTTLVKDPYPTYRRMREEAPLYYNAQHDFYALSRFEDCQRGLPDWQTFSSARGAILELIKADIEIPPGTLIFEDPPIHDLHRGLLSKVFTPRRVRELEPQIREYCRRSLDPLVGSGRFDLIKQFGSEMPMRVIGMLLGIPESGQEEMRDKVDEGLRVGENGQMEFSEGAIPSLGIFEDYLDWRVKHPSDDLMTELLNATFVDESGVERTLTREELLLYITVLAGAGTETTTRRIGWTGVLLAQHPEQRRQVVQDRSLVGAAITEILRFEAPGPHIARYVTRDVEFHGQNVPAGSAVLFVVASANRDDRRYPDGDSFDIHRGDAEMLTFGLGPHYCLGNSLAKLEGRVALEELLDRFPEWEVDYDGAELSQTSTVRGWETLPVVIG